MSLTSFLSSFLPTVYADAPEDKEEKEEQTDSKEEEEEESSGGDEPAEEEEEEPEDEMPALREECQDTAKCAPFTKHFMHCQEKVESGEGFKGEDCVEEIMMHCVDSCVAPRLFNKLR